MYKKGDIISGKVTGIKPYGIFISIDENYTGLIHVSEISNYYVSDINKYAKINELKIAKIIDIDEENKHINLSIKNIKNYNCKNSYRKKIIETKHGFKTLAYKLPYWIRENIENNKK